METNVEKDLNNDSYSSSGDKDTFLILSQEEVALQKAKLEDLEDKLTEALAKIEALDQDSNGGNVDEEKSDLLNAVVDEELDLLNAKLEASQNNEKGLMKKLAKFEKKPIQVS